MNLSIDDVTAAIEAQKIVLIKGVFADVPQWKDFEKLYHDSPTTEYASIIGMSSSNAQMYNDLIWEITRHAESAHPGTLIHTMTITHFENATTKDEIPQEAFSLYSEFRRNNTEKIPTGFDYGLLTPTIHTDPVDGIFVQCTGSVLWSAYYDDMTFEEFVAEAGDVVIVPRDIRHSVETLEPRSSLSISFHDA